MPRHAELAAFYQALEDDPGDAVTLRVLADWFEDHGWRDEADCLRWVVRLRRRPFRYSRDAGLAVTGSSMKDGWFWWAIDDPHYGRDWGHPRTCRLPPALWNRLRNPFDFEPLVFKHYPTAEEAYEALLAAWPLAWPALRERVS